MLLNRHVFGFNKHEIIDKRLFQSANALFDTAGITRYITIDGPDSNTVSARTYYQTCNDFPVSVVDLHCTGHCKPKLAFRTTASAAYTCDECSACATITQDILTVCTGWWDEDDVGGGGGGTEPGEGGGPGGDNPPDPGDPCAGGRIIGARLPAGCGGGGGSAGGGGGWIPVVPDEDKVDENGFYASRKAELTALLENDPAALLPCDEIAEMERYGLQWQNIASFELPQNLKDRLDNLSAQSVVNPDRPKTYYQQTLADAAGGVVNCDYFPIKITSIPQGYTPESLLEHFRLNINSFITDLTKNSFEPYVYGCLPLTNSCVDDTDWFGMDKEGSVGSLVHIKIRDYLGENEINVDGTVMLSNYIVKGPPTFSSSFNQFTFTTVFSYLDKEHPVAGNRAFGIFTNPQNSNEYIFYTSGVDRPYTTRDRFVNWAMNNISFKEADKLWENIQENFINWVNNLPGGQASTFPQKKILARPDWDDVKKFLRKEIDFNALKQKLGC